MDRRAVLGAAIAFAVIRGAGRAQQPPVIGFLSSASQDTYGHIQAAFARGLNESFFVEGQNVTIEYLFAEGHYDRLPELAGNLVSRHVDVIIAGGSVTALAAKAATSTIPIVSNTGDDPVKLGLVQSLARPGGNVTGVTVFAHGLGTKRLELLHELLPKAKLIAMLVNPKNPNADRSASEVRAAGQAIGLAIHIARASSERESDPAFADIVRERADALIMDADPLFNSRRKQLVGLAASHAVPTIYDWREYAEAGGLMSYGTSLTEMYRQVGLYAGRILKGAKPGDLPVMQPTTFQLVVNLRTAKSIGLTIPPSLVVRADEVIE
jgi:putative tryptophan/tyrosine transport system substrate-binding protein